MTWIRTDFSIALRRTGRASLNLYDRLVDSGLRVHLARNILGRGMWVIRRTSVCAITGRTFVQWESLGHAVAERFGSCIQHLVRRQHSPVRRKYWKVRDTSPPLNLAFLVAVTHIQFCRIILEVFFGTSNRDRLTEHYRTSVLVGPWAIAGRPSASSPL